METKEQAIFWWNEHFGDDVNASVLFNSSFFPKLLHYSSLNGTSNEIFSIDELFVVAKYGIATSTWQHNTITRIDFLYFLARFGPLESSLMKLVECFISHREMVTWFHGTLSRSEAEKILMAKSCTNGSFLVRYSESHQKKFTLSYQRETSTTREIRNVLIENRGRDGYVLTDSPKKVYPSIMSFIQCSAKRLSHGIPSSLARMCNQELAAVRARQDLLSNSYTSFSSESIESSQERSLLFSTSSDNQASIINHFGQDYSAFTMTNLFPPLVASSHGEDYVSFSSNTIVPHDNQRQENEYGSFCVPDVYGTFESLTPVDILTTGIKLYQQQKLEMAFDCFLHAYQLAQKQQDQMIQARALGNMGTIYLDLHQPNEAVKCYEQCLDITRLIHDLKRERTILNNLILACMACHQYQRAYDYSIIQLQMTMNETNQHKIISRMSLLREHLHRLNT